MIGGEVIVALQLSSPQPTTIVEGFSRKHPRSVRKNRIEAMNELPTLAASPEVLAMFVLVAAS